MAKIQLSEAEFAGLVRDVLQRLARDKSATHLWHWQSRPECADEPVGPARRSHLAALVGLLGTAALPSLASSGCGSDSDPEPQPCGDDPCASDAASETLPESSASDARTDCADDLCGCADDPCACGDDPCACADDPCACADDPCAPDATPTDGSCGDDPCMCADDPCASDGGN